MCQVTPWAKSLCRGRDARRGFHTKGTAIFRQHTRSFAVTLATLCGLVALGGCISDPAIKRSVRTPYLTGLDTADGADDALVTADGRALAMTVWRAQPDPALPVRAVPKAIVIALHGMNDYAHAFEGAGSAWAESGLTVYAYDQRSFGRSRTDQDRWPGTAQLVLDLKAMVAAVRDYHPATPVFVLGHSMGGAVVMQANRAGQAPGDRPLGADGVIVAAPAIWGGARMPLAYRLTLSIAATLAPDKTLTGARAARQSTDNIPILRGMQADPLVLKETPLRNVAGLVRLMGRANTSARDQQGDILFLLGCRDELVPVDDLTAVAETIAGSPRTKTTVHGYEAGWHLLFRDLQASRVWADVGDWVADRVVGRVAARPPVADAPPSLPDQGKAPQKNGTVQPGIKPRRTVPSCSGPSLSSGGGARHASDTDRTGA
ncbi:MAG: alpha/beta fold hydrolase [Pseudomonadota bacterium]